MHSDVPAAARRAGTAGALTFALFLAPLLVGAVVLGPGLAAQQSESNSSIDFSVRYWLFKARDTDLLIRDTVGSGPLLGQKVSLVDTFGVDDGPKGALGLRTLIGYKGALYIRGGYQRMRLQGNAFINQPTAFAGYTLQTGSATDTSTRFDFFEVGVQYNFVNSTAFKLGVLLEPKIVNFRARVTGVGQEGNTGPFVPFREKEEEIIPVPLIGLSAELKPFDWLGLRGEAKGLKLPNADNLGLGIDGDVTAFDWEASLAIYLGDAFAVTGGYRSLMFDFEFDQSGQRRVETDLKFSGWFAALDLKF